MDRRVRSSSDSIVIILLCHHFPSHQKPSLAYIKSNKKGDKYSLLKTRILFLDSPLGEIGIVLIRWTVEPVSSF